MNATTLRTLTASAAFAAAGSTAFSAQAETYTWTGATDANWNTSSTNWTVGGNPASWVDNSVAPNDAVFNLPASATITVDGQRAVHDLSIVSTSSPTFSGSGSLEVSGIVSNLSTSAKINIPLVGANPLRIAGNAGDSFTLNANNTYSGGTYVYGLNNGTSGGMTIVLKKGDDSLGTPPVSPSDNIFANDLGTVFLYNGSPWTLNANRRIVIGNGYRFSLGSSDTLTVKGEIHGETTGGLDYPTNTHFLVKQNWSGLMELDPGAGHTNDVGTLNVRGRLNIASGVTRVAIGLDNTKNTIVQSESITTGYRNGGKALVYVCGGGPGGSRHVDDYDSRYGQLAVNGGQIASPEDQWNIQSPTDINKYFQAIDHANVSVTNGSIILPNATYLNGDVAGNINAPARLSIGEGGEVNIGKIVVAGSSRESEINLGVGGVLKTAQFVMSTSNPGSINLDGGAIYPVSVSGISESDFLGPYSGNANWANVTLNVMAGGALFTPTDKPAFCNLPLKSGVAPGETDGGLTVRGTREFVFHATGSDYNGPTTVEGGSLMQVRTANALPGGTTLRIGLGSYVRFFDYNTRNDLAQTIARVEGHGTLEDNSHLVVTNGVAPVYNGQYGTLTFKKACSLSGDLEIEGDADGCGCLRFEQPGQSLAGLTLKMANPAAFAENKGGRFYKVVDAPNGYTDTFAAVDLPSAWDVRYEAGAVYLLHIDATVLIMR